MLTPESTPAPACCPACRRRERRRELRRSRIDDGGKQESFDGLERQLRSYAKRVPIDPSALDDLVALRARVDAAIADAVQVVRAEPHAYSWREVGAALGVSPQAAQQRYGGEGARRPGGQPASRR